MVVCTVAGFVVIIVCLVFAFTLTRKTSKRVLETILEPLHAIEDVAMELTEGNLHSTLEYQMCIRDRNITRQKWIRTRTTIMSSIFLWRGTSRLRLRGRDTRSAMGIWW